MKLEQSFDVAAPIDRVWKALVDVEHVAPCLPGAAVTGRNEDGSYSGSFTVKIGLTSASYTGRLEMDQIDEATRTARMHAVGTDKRGQGGARATILSTLTEQGPGATRVEVVTDYHITGRLARFGRGGMIEDISSACCGSSRRAYRLRWSAARSRRRQGRALPRRLRRPPDRTPRSSPTPRWPGRPTSPSIPRRRCRPERRRAGCSGPPAPPAIAAPHETAAPPPPPRPLTPPAPADPVQGLSLVTGVMLDRIRRNPAPFVATLVVLLGLMRRRRRRRRRRGAAAALADD